MVRISIILLVTGFWSFSSYSANLYSIADGNWNNGSVWSYTPGGPPCNCTPSSADNITINHNIILTMHLINQGSSQNGITGVLTINSGASLTGNYDVDIRSAGTLILCGTLSVRNVIFSNGSIINVCSSGELIVNGTFENKNNSNTVTIDGNMTVHGTYTNGNGGIISGSGNLTLMTGPASNTGTTLGCTGVDPCSTYPCVVTPCAILPIQLISFNAMVKNKTVELKWSTASEKNNDIFTVEKSEDGIEFTPVLVVRGAGNSETLLNYSATDISPSGGISYYRLKQTDFDGRFSYSSIVAVKNLQAIHYQIIPNPSNGKNIVFSVTAPGSMSINIIIRDLSGRVITEQIHHTQPDHRKSTFQLEEGSIPAEGIYTVSFNINGEIFTEKLIISY